MNDKNYLSHLNNDDIELLYERYLNGESKVDLLIEYNLQIKPNKFPRVLPPISLNGECWVCKEQLFIYRRARSTKYYTCVSCKNKFTIKEFNTKNIQKTLLANKYTSNIQLKDLKTNDKFYLVTLLKLKSQIPCLWLKDSRKYAFTVNRLLFPTSELAEEILSELVFKNMISIDLISNVDMECFEDSSRNINVMDYYWTHQILDSCSEPLTEEELLELLLNDLKCELRDEENKVVIQNLLMNIYSEELIQFIKLKLDEVSIDSEIPRLAIKQTICESLKLLPMTYIRYFIHLKVKNICYSLQNIRVSRQTLNTIPRTIKDYTQRAVSEKWEVKYLNKPREIIDCAAITLLCDIFEDVEYEYFSKEIPSYLKDKLI